MPTISSYRSKPSLPPVTMLARTERVSPCRARTVRWSELRATVKTFESIVTERLDGIDWLSLPLGPSARTVLPSTATLTPWGTGMGFLPIRDMAPVLLPDVGEDFAAQMLLLHLAVGHHAGRGGEDRDTHAAQDRRDLVLGHVDPPARARHAHDTRDDLLAARPVLEIDPQRTLLVVLDDPEVLDEPLVLEDLGHAQLELRRRDVDLLVLGAAGVADAREEIGDRIADHGLPARLDHAGHLALERELTEADAAGLELAEVAARSAADLAAVVGAHLVLRGALLLHDE